MGFLHRRGNGYPAAGLNEDVIRHISAKRGAGGLDWRLKAFRHWQTMEEPRWPHVKYEPIDYQGIATTRPRAQRSRIGRRVWMRWIKLLKFRQTRCAVARARTVGGVAVDAVFDSVSVGTTHRELAKHGVIFCSFSRRCVIIRNSSKNISARWYLTRQRHAELGGVQRWIFVYIPKGVRCPLELSTYFRINAAETGQFERVNCCR